MSARPPLFTRGLSGLGQSSDVNSPAEERDDAKRNFLKTMRALPTQHYWHVFFDRHAKEQQQQQQQQQQQGGSGSGEAGEDEYKAELEQLGGQIESVQDFWRYNNNTPVDQIKMRESIYLFKAGFRPVWEDRRNILGGSWTFRVPKTIGPDFWTRVQLLAIGEQLQEALDESDQLCGVGLSVRFNSHLITVWHRDATKKKSVDGMLACILENLTEEMRPRPDTYFYKRHSDHAGFKAPPELQAVLDSRDRAEKQQQQQQAESSSGPASAAGSGPSTAEGQPELTVQSPS